MEDIDLNNAEYSDDDEQIYFDKRELVDHLLRLEECNLFDLNQCQNDQQQLELQIAQSEATLKQLEAKLQD